MGNKSVLRKTSTQFAFVFTPLWTAPDRLLASVSDSCLSVITRNRKWPISGGGGPRDRSVPTAAGAKSLCLYFGLYSWFQCQRSNCPFWWPNLEMSLIWSPWSGYWACFCPCCVLSSLLYHYDNIQNDARYFKGWIISPCEPEMWYDFLSDLLYLEVCINLFFYFFLFFHVF